MKNVCIGFVGILSSVIIYWLYYASLITINHGSISWNEYQDIMDKSNNVLYLPLFISIILFLLGIFFLFTGFQKRLSPQSGKQFHSVQAKNQINHSRRIF